MYSSYDTHRKSYTPHSINLDGSDYKRKTQFYRKSIRSTHRKPIFDKNDYRLPKEHKLFIRSYQGQPPVGHIQQVRHDDFCGCEHNLEPCLAIQALLKNVSEKQMRQQYGKLQRLGSRELRAVLQDRYFRFLPKYYPQLYEAHLANIVNYINEPLSLNQFLCVAWIQFHAKLEHITFFIYSDLSKSLGSNQKFRYSVEIALIKAESNFSSIVQSTRQRGIALLAFIDDYYQSVGAVVIPLSQYARFVKTLLRRGIKALLQLLVILLTSKRNSFLEVLDFYASGKMREQSRQLPWQQFLEQLQVGFGKD